MFIKRISFAAVFAAALSLIACACLTSLHAKEEVKASTTTLENLMAAYNGESNAQARYLGFAKKANEEGFDAVASLFRAAALAEQVHLERTADVIKRLGGTPKATLETPVVNSTKENLESARKAETYENKVMYPAFLKQAEKERVKDAVDVFEDAGPAEGVHAELFARMLKNLTLSKGLAKDFYVCPVCGNIVDAITSSMCPICATDTKKFKKVR